MGTAHGGRAQVCTGGMEGPGKQYPYEKTGGLERGRFKPIEEPGAEEKDPVVFTGLETVWVTVDKVGIPTLGLDGTGPARPPTLAPAPEGSGIMEETDMVGLPTDTKGLGTDPSQKQSLPVILIASKGKVSLTLLFTLCKLSKSITYQLNTHYFTSVKAVIMKLNTSIYIVLSK